MSYDLSAICILYYLLGNAHSTMDPHMPTDEQTCLGLTADPELAEIPE